MTFDPTSGEVLCVTLPKDHCVQVPWEYIKVCGYSDHYCKNLDLWPHICWGLMGGTTLNQLPIGLHVKILNFNGRFEAYWATFGMLSWYQSIQNRWKFNICFNVWYSFLRYGSVNSAFLFLTRFQASNRNTAPSYHTGLLSSSKQYFIFLRF